MTFAPAAIDELVHAAIETCAAALSTRPVELKLPALPRVNVDREYIEKVLCNLLENAAKYSGPGTPIFVSAEPQPRNQPDFVAISIADRGVGIEATEQSLIFDRFYRARGNAFQTSGTGMGLAISRAILEAHHGAISVTSQPGQGSVFTFTLPVLPSRA